VIGNICNGNVGYGIGAETLDYAIVKANICYTNTAGTIEGGEIGEHSMVDNNLPDQGGWTPPS
jgi:hypothetical protein